MKYRSKVETVEAFRFTADTEFTGPEWFCRMVKSEKACIDRALVDGATVVTGCTIWQEKARIRAKNGDWIVRWEDGTVTAESQKRFRQRFEKEGAK